MGPDSVYHSWWKAMISLSSMGLCHAKSDSQYREFPKSPEAALIGIAVFEPFLLPSNFTLALLSSPKMSWKSTPQ
ncbi:hypothetical protein RRG08_027656 [Elysia crispata]|uniref:Uncharacterized protein n=1 Tax=Elysia crispata TaxID=231223 RepID=A0AAE0XME7_9GAST|nr:hypothetical protein RRG08_027656 [Elysia crispata]